MNSYSKATFLALTLTSLGFADPQSQPSPAPEFMVPAFTSPAGGCVGENGPFVMASYLYWKARATDSTITAKYNASTQTGIAADLDLQSMPFSYDSGFKLGLGKVLQHDSWSALVNWTWLESHPRKTWSSPTPIYTNYLTESLTDKVVATGKIPFILAEQVKANWDFNFNMVTHLTQKHKNCLTYLGLQR